MYNRHQTTTTTMTTKTEHTHTHTHKLLTGHNRTTLLDLLKYSQPLPFMANVLHDQWYVRFCLAAQNKLRRTFLFQLSLTRSQRRDLLWRGAGCWPCNSAGVRRAFCVVIILNDSAGVTRNGLSGFAVCVIWGEGYEATTVTILNNNKSTVNKI